MSERGGARPGAGRKPKDKEEKAKRLSIKALVETFGSEEEAFKHAAQKAQSDDKNSYQYFKILIEYAYGKPKEKTEMELNIPPIFNLYG
ncbi:MAG: hypothetical protein AAF600_10995 [Bacteroidota bacterium]